jgi:heterodisulfide reductase subunit C
MNICSPLCAQRGGDIWHSWRSDYVWVEGRRGPCQHRCPRWLALMVRCLRRLACQKGRQERGGEGLFGFDQGLHRRQGEHGWVGA